jgi:hypothetical protein
MAYGNAKDLPPAREFADGWTIGKPDVVFELPEEQTVPAGRYGFKQFYTPTGFAEDRWIQAVEIRPSNPPVVHHVNIMYRQHGDRGDSGTLIKANPGRMSWTYPDGHARLVKAGTEWHWDMHYESNGKPDQKDRTQMGIVFYKGPLPPKQVHTCVGLTNGAFKIPPGDPHYKVESMWNVPCDLEVTTLSPHMHLRGSAFEVEVIYPDDVTETILSVPAYDFNWQTIYELRTPLRLTPGCKIHSTAYFDNSAKNKWNPDPTDTIGWGDDSSREMMLLLVDFVAYDKIGGELVTFIHCPYPEEAPHRQPAAMIWPARDAGYAFPLSEYWWVSLLSPVPLAGLVWVVWRRRSARRGATAA